MKGQDGVGEMHAPNVTSLCTLQKKSEHVIRSGINCALHVVSNVRAPDKVDFLG